MNFPYILWFGNSKLWALACVDPQPSLKLLMDLENSKQALLEGRDIDSTMYESASDYHPLGFIKSIGFRTVTRGWTLIVKLWFEVG